jgi:hypothetical protein
MRYPDAPSMRAALQPFVGKVPTPPLPTTSDKRNVERPISVRDLLNARTAVADISAFDGHTSAVDTAGSADIEPELDPQLGVELDLERGLDPGATLRSAPPSPEDMGLLDNLQTRLMAAVSDAPVQPRGRSALDPPGVARIPSDSGPVISGSRPRTGGSGPVSAGGIPRSTESAPRPAPLAPSRETSASSGVGRAETPVASERSGAPWWVWLLAAAAIGGLGGFVATRI